MLRALIAEEEERKVEEAKDEGNRALREKLAKLRVRGRGESDESGDGRNGRAGVMADVLDRSATSLGLNPKQTAAIADLLHNEVSGGGLGGGRGALSALLPGLDPEGTDGGAVAYELVRSALSARQHKTRCKSFEELDRRLWRAINQSSTTDPALSQALLAHYRRVVGLHSDQSWKVAEDYHHRVLQRVEDGQFDITSGEDVWSLTLALNAKKGKAGGRKDKEWCDVHGWCAHSTTDCTGKKSKNPPAKQ
jgi:hypothetical protein